MSFGDGPAATALFYLLQVPLWYRYKTGGSQLVFANIPVVHNEVGLLDCRQSMAALGMKLRFSDKDGQTMLTLNNKPLDIEDTGTHRLVVLDSPRSFLWTEKGIALFRTQLDDQLRSKPVQADVC
jgi:hypothetical protein